MNEYASFGKRVLAFLIDGILINLIGLVFYFTGYWYTSLLIWLLYFTLMEGSPMQATLGKKALNIVVVNAEGRPIGYGSAFVRSLGKLLSGAILGIGYLMAAFTDGHQALHDKLADTYVVEAGYHPSQMPVQGYAPVSGTPQLVGIAGDFAGKCFPIGSNGIMIGRDSVACQIVFPANAKGISRHHCIISYTAQTRMFVLNDIGSSYGTFTANGARVLSGQPVALNPGERFFLGSKSTMFEVRV